MIDLIEHNRDAIADLCRQYGVRKLAVFGSAAKGTMRADSDVDLAVSGLPPENFFKALGTVSSLIDQSIHLIDLDEVTPFTRYLKEEGELQRVG